MLDQKTLRRMTTGNVASYWARWQMDLSGLSGMFTNRPTDAIPPQSYDLWNLYRNIRTRKPRVVVECGVGCSSLVLAEAVYRNGTGHVFTVDANEHWLDVAKRDVQARLRDCITFTHSPLALIEHDGKPCSRYTQFPDVVPNFLYLDGPAPSDIPGWPKGMAVCSIDPLDFEPRLPAGFRMVIDGRAENVAFLERHLKRRYHTHHDNLFKLTTLDLIE